MKSKNRALLLDRVQSFNANNKASMQSHESPEDFVGTKDIIKNIFTLDDLGLQKGEISIKPWSDYYWPYYEGLLANRYNVDEFRRLENWQEKYEYINQVSAKDIINDNTNYKIQDLASSEKYDYLLSSTFPLTDKMWRLGNDIYKKYGDIEYWMGLCHGWAMASIRVMRPLHSINVSSFDGTNNISLFPSDIRSLITLSWANGNTPVRVLGARCESTHIELDEIGRIIESDCFDTNPAHFHIVASNMIGRFKKSFIMDKTYSYEVWNQPVVGYSIKYFNVLTMKTSINVKDSIIDYSLFKKDHYRKYRDKNVKKIVGVKMTVDYLVENAPTANYVSDFNDDVVFQDLYIYDLELNDEGLILGGEWYQLAHPDFLWVPDEKTKPYTMADYLIVSDSLWDGKSKIPDKWIKLGVDMAKKGLPLYKIVESFIELSRN